MTFDLERLVRWVRPRSTSRGSIFHGEDHWREVAAIGLTLANDDGTSDPIVVVAFAVLHDAQRIGDDNDPQHGDRGATLARSLDRRTVGISLDQLDLIEAACRGHTGGRLSDDSTIGVCWDADRLTLRRVGIEPERRYLSTPAGIRALGALDAAPRRVPTWSELALMLRRTGG